MPFRFIERRIRRARVSAINRMPARAQFTIRSLLLAVAAVCVVAACLSGRMARQRHALEALRGAHAMVLFDDQRAGGDFDPSRRGSSHALAQRFIADTCRTIVLVRVAGGSVDAHLLRALAAAGTVEHLSLSQAHLSEPATEAIASMRTLISLCLDGTDADDAAVVKIARLPCLEYLDLSDTKITDASLLQLLRNRHLRELDVSGTSVTKEGVARCRDANERIDVTFAYRKQDIVEPNLLD